MWIFPSFLPFSFNSQHSGIRARFKAAAFVICSSKRDDNWREFCATYYSSIWWSLRSLEHVDGNFFRSKEYWSLVETGYVEPESGAVLTEVQQKKLDEMKLKDLKVKNYFFQAIDLTILETIWFMPSWCMSCWLVFNQIVCLDFGPQTRVINKIYKPILPCTRVALASIA